MQFGKVCLVAYSLFLLEYLITSEDLSNVYRGMRMSFKEVAELTKVLETLL